jgi:alkaline phosphatase
MFIAEMYDFDTAISEGLMFADDNPETLVIVTADHETGGMTLEAGESKKTVSGAEFSTDEHTAVMVPVFSKGPFAQKFSGIIDNADIGKWLIELVDTSASKSVDD